LAELILNNILTAIYRSDINDLLFYEIPKNIKSDVFTYLIKQIDKITMIENKCNVLLSGKIYEYFIGRDDSAISELGAYFTDRHIVEYIIKKLNPSLNSGKVPSMVDMFGGSGGFTTGYINFLNDKYESINWQTEINNISHFDMNEDVIKSAGLEFFCLTGVLPNMNNLKYKNSFTDEFNGQKYHYPLTNPPYGGDKNNKSENQIKREKIKKYIKNELVKCTDEKTIDKRTRQLKNLEKLEKLEKKEQDKTKVSVSECSARIQKFANEHQLKGNDKESCSLMLLMDILEFGGTAIGVLKEGVFFNKTYKDIRKCLVQNYNVREVISVPADQFENTKTYYNNLLNK
jgi:type I restriction-modification system DNA methylase subunit